MSKDEMSFGELMDLEARLRQAEAAPEQESIGRALRTVQAHVNAAPARTARPWSQRLSMLAIIGVPAAAAAAIAAVFLLNGHPQKAIVPAPASTPSPSPESSPTALVASPSPIEVSLGPCRLPVANMIGFASNGKDGGFVHYPDGPFTADPSAALVLPHGQYTWQTTTSPVLKGDRGPSYDLAAHRWVPASYPNISADGGRYVYADLVQPDLNKPETWTTPIHVVDVATGSDRVVHAGDQYSPIAWEPEGIYVTHHVPQADSEIGLWKMNPETGSVTQIDAPGVNWLNVGFGAAWKETLNPADKNPSATKLPADTAVRLDIATGKRMPWLYRPGRDVRALGYDAVGHPLVSVTSYPPGAPTELWLMTAPEQGTRILPFTGSDPQWRVRSTFGGATGIWISLERGDPNSGVLYRYTAAEGWKLIAHTDMLPVGGCH